MGLNDFKSIMLGFICFLFPCVILYCYYKNNNYNKFCSLLIILLGMLFNIGIYIYYNFYYLEGGLRDKSFIEIITSSNAMLVF